MVKLIAKIALFASVMLLVAWLVPYDRVVDAITGLFDFQSADKVTRFILGEPDPEVWESLHDYFSILVNILIGIPLFSAVMTIYDAVINHTTPASHTKEWGLSTARRFLKVFGFTFLFWMVFRIVPYESLVNDSRNTLVFLAIVIINIVITTAVYVSTMKLIKKTRS